MLLGLCTCSLYFGWYFCLGWEWTCARARFAHVARCSDIHVDRAWDNARTIIVHIALARLYMYVGLGLYL